MIRRAYGYLATMVQYVTHIPTPPHIGSSSELEREGIVEQGHASSSWRAGEPEASEVQPRGGGKLATGSSTGGSRPAPAGDDGICCPFEDDADGVAPLGPNVPLALAVALGFLPVLVVYVSFVQVSHPL